MNMIWWLIAFVIFLVLEFSTVQLVSVWFAVGSIAGMVVAGFGGGIEIQLIAFLAVSLLLLMMVRPLASKYMQKHTTKTNADSLVGQTARVTGRINNREGFGTAIVNGMEWTAVSSKADCIIPVDTIVVIKSISGVKLVVEEAKGE